METLGLSSTPQKSDNIFQRLLWPTISNQYDVDLLGQQGFWVCTIVGVLSAVVLLIAGQAIAGIFTAFVFFAGACGVRQRSVVAASLIFAIYLLEKLSGLVVPSAVTANPVLGIVILMLLLANVRAAVISSRWIASPSVDGDAELPGRSTLTAADRFANVLPATLWPKIKHVFFVASALYLVLGIIGTVFLSTHKLPEHPSGQHTGESVPLQVQPPS